MFLFSFICTHLISFFFFFNDTATTEIYTLSLHDALPILIEPQFGLVFEDHEARVVELAGRTQGLVGVRAEETGEDRKSTRLNSSHQIISYAVFCLKKKKKMESVCDLQ